MSERPDGARVVVTVGTDHHPFDRLIGWMDRWAAAHPDVDVFVQRGPVDAPTHARSAPLLPYDELVAAMAAADVVVAQGGPAGIVDARSVGRRPIVVARLAALGEVVDDHQVTFVRHMAERGDVLAAADEPQLAALIDAALADPSTVVATDDAGALAATVAAFAAAVDPIVATRPPRRLRRGRRNR